MKFKLPLLAVKNVNVSKRFYQELFNQKVVLDLGKNVTFNGGFAIQEDFAWLVDLPVGSVIEKSNNMELYFEVDDFDEFMQRLEKHKNIEYVHQPKKHEWQQRVVRIYDPDYHIIEIGESIGVIAKRYLNEGYSIEQTSQIIQHPTDFVKMFIKDND
ncbi:MAG: glyoxalase/bleomycin resistance/dioxygenase family protein [Tepidibacter sp.]|jgi:catechol 2,3-dioxygenase-like lactoylglutathione lyase family enzyme|uniref:glyoxalase/bleomycin resistance/dioxygenase family protein n=1 Tax=Tepidibacter sp. TaxID=2529387 RepID=UPI0025E6382D|nr:glyoxalase/bleomycin resistance/dioxygenase family protein [Tepidibacter sp.]MCT4508212.1 glyoxalase/bleomycin resistance/dioxygenase family protein [Tepidibacter sp.]